MALNQPNPQRGTGVRKPAPAAPPAAGGRPGMPRPRPAGAPAPAPAGGAKRPPLRPAVAPPKGGGGKGNKILVLVILLLLVGMIAYGFIPRGAGKPSLFMGLARHFGLFKAKAPVEGEETAGPDLDKRYKRALEARDKAKAYLDDQQKFADQPALLTPVVQAEVVRELEKFRALVETGVDDLGRVADAAGKDTTIDAATAKEEQKKQKAFTMELGKQLMKWKGSKESIFSKEPEFVAAKFDPPGAEKKPEGKKDPNRGATVVAPATPTDIPKPAETEKPKEEPKPEPEKPKEEPKPEPKPEPEKPKPAEPKPEPERPKEVAKADPKPEPEKPKEQPKPEPKPEPEKPKPAEPKPEPEKPKEEPKPEPKPEPKVEKKVDVVVAEADQLVLEGTPMAREVLAASKNLPDDTEKLKTLSMKLETAQAFFIKARDTYSGVKETAPPAADVAAKLAKIEKILSILQSAADGIKSKLK